MEDSDRHTRPILTSGRDNIRHRVRSGSLSRTPSLYAVSFLLLAAVIVGFILNPVVRIHLRQKLKSSRTGLPMGHKKDEREEGRRP